MMMIYMEQCTAPLPLYIYWCNTQNRMADIPHLLYVSHYLLFGQFADLFSRLLALLTGHYGLCLICAMLKAAVQKEKLFFWQHTAV